MKTVKANITQGKSSFKHTMVIEKIESLPEHCEGGDYKTFYVVKSHDEDGPIRLYLGKGYKRADDSKSARETVAWYPQSGSMWYSCGYTLIEAIEGAIQDAWKYA